MMAKKPFAHMPETTFPMIVIHVHDAKSSYVANLSHFTKLLADQIGLGFQLLRTFHSNSTRGWLDLVQ